jgi:hypothetical protein
MQLSSDDQIDKVLSASKYRFQTFSNSETKNQFRLNYKAKNKQPIILGCLFLC